MPPFLTRTETQTREERIHLVENILQYCVEPRARLSLPDAVFSYQMVKRLHSMNTAGFHTIVFFDQVRLSRSSASGRNQSDQLSSTASHDTSLANAVLLH